MTPLKPSLWCVDHKIGSVCVLSEGQRQAPKHGEWFMSLFGEMLAATINPFPQPFPPTPPELPPAAFLSMVPAATCSLTASLLQPLTLCTVRSDLSLGKKEKKKLNVLEQLCVVLQCYRTVWCIGLMDNQ